MQERKIYVFGGWDTPVCYNDMYMLDLGENKHLFSAFRRFQVLGIHILIENVWSPSRSDGVFRGENHRERSLPSKVSKENHRSFSGQLQTHFFPTSSSSWHGSAALSDTKFLIHGGYNGNNALCDTFIFDIGDRLFQ